MIRDSYDNRFFNSLTRNAITIIGLKNLTANNIVAR